MGLSLEEFNGIGARTKRKRIIGTKLDYPTRTAALKQVSALQLEINQETTEGGSLTVLDLVKYYSLKEFASTGLKTAKTVAVYEQHLRLHILPRWGHSRLEDMKAPMVEDWLSKMTLAPATKAKTRNIMSALFQHAMRYSWATSNPMRLVRQSSKRVEEPEVLSAAELSCLMAELSEPSRTIIRLAATTGCVAVRSLDRSGKTLISQLPPCGLFDPWSTKSLAPQRQLGPGENFRWTLAPYKH